MPAAATAGLRLRASRLLSDSLSDPSTAVRLAAVATMAEEGLESHARLLVAYLAGESDGAVEDAIRRAALAHRWPAQLDPWSKLLVAWASGDVMAPGDQAPPAAAAEAGVQIAQRRWPVAAIVTAFDLAAVSALAVVVGRHSRAFTGLPKGADAWGHVSKIHILLDSFPHIAWSAYRYPGLPQVQQSYPPLFHLLGAAVAALTGWPAPRVVVLLGGASVVAAAWCAYALVLLVARRRMTALAAATLFVASPSLWAHFLVTGAYPQLLALAEMVGAVLLAARLVRRRSRRTQIGTIALLGCALCTHVLVGVVACAVVGLILVLAPGAGTGERLRRALAVGLPAAGLSAFFYLPLLLLPHPRTQAQPGTSAASLRTLFGSAHPLWLDALPAALVPLALLAVAVFLALARRSGIGSRSPRRAALLRRAVTYRWQDGEPGEATAGSVSAGSASAGSASAGSVDSLALATVCACLVVGIACVLWTLAGHAGVPAARSELRAEDLYVQGSWMLAVVVGAGAAWAGDHLGGRATVSPALALALALLSLSLTTRLVAGSAVDGSADPTTGAALAGGLVSSASPVAAATTAPAAMVIGPDSAYSTFFDALAPAGADTAEVIPVEGGRYVDDRQRRELATFATVVLYQAQAHSWKHAARMLASYVRGGGNLVIEAAGLPQGAIRALAGVSPVLRSHERGLRGNWHFGAEPSPLLDGVDLSGFGPALYRGRDAWATAVADAVAPWASTVLSSAGSPIVVSGVSGRGRVTWTGMNLPFHVTTSGGAGESRLLVHMLATPGGLGREVPPESGSARAVSAEEERVRAPVGASGVLYQETSMLQWRATVDGRRAAVYRTGPGFMYVSLSGRGPATVVFTYHQMPVELAGAAVSLLTLLGLVVFGAGTVRRAPARSRRRRSPAPAPR